MTRGRHIKAKPVFLTGALLLAASLALPAQSQPDGENPRATNYKLGQVWTMKQGSTVTILAIEDVPKVGRVVHVRVDNIPWQSCGDVHVTRTLEHIAVVDQVLLASGLTFSKENVDLPQSSIEAYRKWQGQKQKKRQIEKIPLPYLIASQGYGPMICNILPSQT